MLPIIANIVMFIPNLVGSLAASLVSFVGLLFPLDIES